MAQQTGLQVVSLDDCDVVLTGRRTWNLLREDKDLRDGLARLHRAGKSLVLLDIGPRLLGDGYDKEHALRFLQGSPAVSEPQTWQEDLWAGMTLVFAEAPEPESCLHPAEDAALWAGLPKDAGCLWNGMRGALVCPAEEMEVRGLSREALLNQWTARGADAAAMQSDSYVAFELAGYYAFSDRADDEAARQGLRDQVRFLVDDAPALAHRINPGGPILTIDLAAQYRDAAGGQARRLLPLANAGRGLRRVPILQVEFGEGAGCMILSQALTAGRLAPDQGEPGHYGVRYDPVAVHLVLNAIALAADAARQVGRP
jgi:hypothetical protein